jgi:phenylacetate-coenzyme A ligase PaaK-like adenylate-forming protein
MRTPLAAPTPHGQQLRAIIERLEQSQWWSAQTLERHQLGQLQRLLAHAHETVPFHRERLTAAGYRPGQAITWEFWRSLPLLRRGDLQDQGDALKSTSLPDEHGDTVKIGTSGSTGRPVSVWRSALQARILDAIVLRKLLWQPCDLRLKFGAVMRDAKGASFAGAHRHYPDWGPPAGLVYQTGPATVIDKQSSTAEIAGWLRSEAPDYLKTTPSVLRDLSFHFMDEGLEAPRLRGILCSAEIVGPDLRELIRRVFGLGVFASYGAREVGTIAVQCPEHEHYHVQAEALLVEVLDDEGAPCAPGETGTVVVTALQGFASPLIRYEIGDRAMVGTPCSCGRPHPVLTHIVGRTRDAVVLPSGERRHCYTLGFAFWQLSDLRHFQIIQRSLYDLEVKLVARRPLTSEVEAEVARRIKAATGDHFSIGFTYHDAIPHTPGGKFQDFICEVDPAPRSAARRRLHDGPEGDAGTLMVRVER